MTEIKKISNEEKELLIIKRIDKINNDKNYAKQIFMLHFKDPFIENWKVWKAADDKYKTNIVKRIIENEDKAITSQGFKLHKLNVNKALQVIAQLKHNQLVEWGIREK